MDFFEFQNEQRFRSAWEAVQIVRRVPYTLFTFGDADLPYYLVLDPGRSGEMVSVREGEIKITKPLILSPDSMEPQFRDFFESDEDGDFAGFLMARSASFSNLRFVNRQKKAEVVTDTVEEAIAKLERRLDAEEEDRVAILSAPSPLGGVALLKYAAERVWESAPSNIQELRERGFLP